MLKVSKSYFSRLFFSFFICSALVLAMFSVVTYFAFERVYTERLRKQSVATAQNIAAALDDAAIEYERTISGLAGDADALKFLSGSVDAEHSLELMRRMYALKNGFSRQAALTLFCVSTGQALTTGAENPKLRQPHIQNWGAFRYANAADGVVVYTVSRDAVLAEDTRICSVLAVFGGAGELLGYIFIEVPRSTLMTIVGEYTAQYNTALMLVNANHSIIFHSHGALGEGIDKLDGVDGLEHAWEDGDSGNVPDSALVYCKATKTALMVLQELPDDIVPQLRKVLSSTALAALIFSLLICLALAYGIARSVSLPVQRLKRSMEKVRQGDLRAKVEVTGHDEIGELGETFNDMTERIEQLVQNVKEKQQSLRVAEAKALSLQVNPHFIYNTLELIRWSAKMNKTDVAVSITVNFGKLLRRILNNKGDMVTVQYEMEMVDAYIEIQRQRYGDRLSVTIDVTDELLFEQIPKIVLQPLVENAIVHGLEDKLGKGQVALTVTADERYLYFTVSDNGVGMSDETLARVRELKADGMYNIGLHNVHERAVLYGDERCGLQISSTLGEGTNILLTVKRNITGEVDLDVQGDSSGG